MGVPLWMKRSGKAEIKKHPLGQKKDPINYEVIEGLTEGEKVIVQWL